MGMGAYSHEAHVALSRGRTGMSAQSVFAQRGCHPLMNPKGVRVRESRDSPDHPASLPIVFALDVTGSMGEIPRVLATSELPRFMKVLLATGVQDAQLLFMAVGDATSDQASLQVGQFESTAELMDQWLTYSFLEGGGGPGIQESYELALYFVAQHTEHDAFVKRGKRGYCFVTGDELPYPSLARSVADGICGDRLDEDVPTEEVVALLQEAWHPFFLLPDDPARRGRCERRWRDLLGDHVLLVPRTEDVVFVAAGAVVLREGLVADQKELKEALEGAGCTGIGPVMRVLAPLF